MTAHNHHFLSQCYLRGFTDGESKNSKLLVFDHVTKKVFQTTPRNVGAERDFNRVDLEGMDPDALERALSEIEGAAALGLRKLNDGAPFEGEVREHVLLLAGLMHIRSPARREHMRKFHAELSEHMMELSLATRERWEGQVARMKGDGAQLGEDIDYDDMKRFVESRQYRIEVPRARHLEIEFKMFNTIMPLLMARKWVVLESNKDKGPFITSDHPLNLLWREPDKIPPFYRDSPGHGLRDTVAWFPVTKWITIVGEFDGEEGRYPASVQLVNNANAVATMFAQRQLYAPNFGFDFIFNDGLVHDGRFLANPIGKS
jgi:hypothetical protein